MSPAPKTPKKEAAPKFIKIDSKGQLAAILIRGVINARHDLLQNLTILRLRKKHVCVLLMDNPTTRGMLFKCKDYITWGEVKAETLQELDSKRKKSGGKIPVYHLNCPRGGFERKGIKKSYEQGGVLGYRADKINELIKKMI